MLSFEFRTRVPQRAGPSLRWWKAETFFLCGGAIQIDERIESGDVHSCEEAGVKVGSDRWDIVVPIHSPIESRILELGSDEAGDVPWMPTFGKQASGDELNARRL